MFRVYIDNGHDPNNVNGGKLGFKEWEGNLKSANYLKELLLNTGKIDALTTYDWNKYAKLRSRGKKASEWGADLVLSIHSNAGGGKGTECYYSVDIPRDKVYAQEICNKISKEFGVVNRGAKVKYSKTTNNEDYSGIIDSAQDLGIKHIFLVESMFHDYEPEERLLLKDETHKKLAKIYAEVICEIFGIEFIFKEMPLEKELEQEKEVTNKTSIEKGKKYVGERCKELQIKLNKAGYDCGSENGIFEEETYNALIRFQEENGLKADGLAGPETFAKLDEVIKAKEDEEIMPNEEIQENTNNNRFRRFLKIILDFFRMN